MLQRQVYRSGPTPVMTAGSGAAVDAELRMDRLEAQMRELTGRIEDAANGVEQLRRRLEQINSDIDVPRSGAAAEPGIELTCRRRHHGFQPHGTDSNAWPWTEYDSCTGRYSCTGETAGQLDAAGHPGASPTGSPDRIRHPNSSAASGAGTRECRDYRRISPAVWCRVAGRLCFRAIQLRVRSVKAGRLFRGGRGVKDLYWTIPGRSTSR